jgi:hypothetical protein
MRLPFCVILLVLRVVSRQVETGVGVEFLEFDLGFESILCFHYHVYKFVTVVVPLFDASEVSGAAFIVDDERHNAMAQAFLEHKESTHAPQLQWTIQQKASAAMATAALKRE